MPIFKGISEGFTNEIALNIAFEKKKSNIIAEGISKGVTKNFFKKKVQANLLINTGCVIDVIF